MHVSPISKIPRCVLCWVCGVKCPCHFTEAISVRGFRAGKEVFSSDATLFSVQVAGTPLHGLELQVQVLPPVSVRPEVCKQEEELSPSQCLV